MISSSIIPLHIFKQIAEKEQVDLKDLQDSFEKGHTVIFYNPNHKDVNPVAIGQGMRVKINANIGMSPNCQNIDNELKKLELCAKYNVDAVMDLSLGKDLRNLRKEIFKNTRIPLGTVPLYELFYFNQDYPENLIDPFLDILEKQGQDGVDFVVIHAGLLRQHLELVESRIIKVTSRGGSLMMKWMEKHNKENFLFTNFDRVLEVCKKYNMAISLGDGMRPATIIDETDEAQIQELKNIGDLVLRCREAGVQSLVEGPGHIPFHKIPLNIKLQKEYCHKAPFYVLGPLVTDIAPGYDHITSAIGATYAATCGADFLCYVTPAEHLSLPDLDDVKEGIIAYKIAAHAADLTRGKDVEWDRNISMARAKVDWKEQRKHVIDQDKFDAYTSRSPVDLEFCTMCGEFCALK